MLAKKKRNISSGRRRLVGAIDSEEMLTADEIVNRMTNEMAIRRLVRDIASEFNIPEANYDLVNHRLSKGISSRSVLAMTLMLPSHRKVKAGTAAVGGMDIVVDVILYLTGTPKMLTIEFDRMDGPLFPQEGVIKFVVFGSTAKEVTSHE